MKISKENLDKEYTIKNQSLEKVGFIFNVSTSTIWRRLKLFKIPIRKAGDKINKFHTKETKYKLRLIHLGKKLSKKTKEKIRNAHLGKKVSDETKFKMRQSGFKGGRSSNSKYILILSHNHPFKNKRGYVFEHRLIIENHIGRYLTYKERVHHINKNGMDNRIENLMLFTSESAHQRWHSNPKKVKSKEILFNGGNLCA